MKNKNKPNKSAPLLLNGEASSPRSLSSVIHSSDVTILKAHLVNDYAIGYFRDGVDLENTDCDGDALGVTLELFREEEKNNYAEKLDSTTFVEEMVKPFRDENGKLTRKGMKELGACLAMDCLIYSDVNKVLSH